jgi:hypothetical protein
MRFTRGRQPEPAPPPIERECWVAGCTDEAILRVDRLHPQMPRGAEICETHDFAYTGPDDDPRALIPLLVRPDWADPDKLDAWLSER